MEVLEVDEENNTPSHLTSASAFVEGGIQEACEDACSICLEAFTETDPSTITSCKHEFHLQCILEWCQRSSNCPMCWQPISLKDPASQELLEAVEQERSFRFTPRRNSTIFHHRTLGDFELQHLPVDVNDAQLEDRIIQHLAAAAAMGRARYVAQRDGSRNRLSAQGRRQLLVFSAHPSTPSAGPVSSSPGEQVEPEAASVTVATPSGPLTAGGDVLPQHGMQFPSVQSSSTSASASGSSVMLVNRHEIAMRRHFSSQSSMPNPDSAGASDFHSLPNSWKSRLNAMSMKYKDSISKSTRVWKEKLFSRSTSMADIGSGVKREVNSGIHNVSHMMERLEASENDTTANVSSFNNLADSSAVEQSNRNNIETPHRETVITDSNAAAFAASSVSH